MEKGSFNFDREKIESHYTFCRISRFFFMSLQIFLYQGLADLYEELSSIQIKGSNIWITPRDMMIYICINSGAPARAKRAWDRASYSWNMVNLFSFGCHVIDRAYVRTRLQIVRVG